MHKLLKRKEIAIHIQEWMRQAIIFAPVFHDNLIEFRRLNDPSEANLDYPTNTIYSAKSIFLPQSEALFKIRNGQYLSTQEEALPFIILGIRPCDVRGLQLLDSIFMGKGYRDPYWAQKRKQATIVSFGCDEPHDTCFCSTMGSGPFDSSGADVLLTRLQDYFVANLRTIKGKRLLGHLPDASASQIEEADMLKKSVKKRMKKAISSDRLKERLYTLFESNFWEPLQQICLGCGVCTYLCPTCYCFDIVDETRRSERVRNWDSCMFRIYSQEGSGHNPRPTNKERIRQRIMHKFAYFVERFHEIGCTGCGRCVRYCPANIDIRAVIQSALIQEKSKQD